MKLTTRQFLGAMLASALPTSRAQETGYPSRPITVIIPFAAGNMIDGICRATLQSIERRHKVNFVVENLPGAGSMIGTMKAARAKPDGYTLFYGTSSGLVIVPQVNANANYKALDLFEPIATLAAAPYFLITPGSSAYRTARNLFEAARAKPNEMSYGTNGIAGSHHVTIAAILGATKAQMRLIPFRTVTDSVMAAVRGDVDLIPATPTSDVMEMIRSGRLRALAVTSSSRLAVAPEVPTVQEALGMPGYKSTAWSALLAPKGTPQSIIAQLNRWANEALQDPAVISYGAKASYLVEGGTPDHLKAKINNEIAYWGEVIRTQNIKHAD